MIKKSFVFTLCLCCFSLSIVARKITSQAPSFDPTQTQQLFLSGKDAASAVDWEFMCTGGRQANQWTTIKVPSCWELQGFGTYQYGMPFYGKANPPGIADEKGLYKTQFNLPAAWEGRIIRLVFEGVMTDCSANINGRRAVKLHQGSFYRFYADVSDRVFFGDRENLLEVTVSKESSNSSVNLAERRADYWNFGGIFRPVFIEALPPFHISRWAVDAQADGLFQADVFLGCALPEGAQLATQLFTLDGKKLGKVHWQDLRPGSDRVHIGTQFEGTQNWTAETPQLYKVEFGLYHQGKLLHRVSERIGFRTIEVREHDGLYINGQKVMIKGVNRHSFRPETGRALSIEDNYADVRLIKEMNMNAVRMSHYPPDPAFLEACDELGLYVMNELAGWHGKYDSEVGSKLVAEMITRDVNHPSIIWWSNGNEGGFNYELEALFKAYDPQKRPVLYPWENRNGFETKHYRSYGETQEYLRKPEIFLPTEFLHGLYDGGHGAGLWDYWEMMRRHKHCAGGFLWVLADEGVVRTDQDNRIDNVGNYGADGIVGPHHEKEGSFYTIRQVWCPVQIRPAGQTTVQVHREEAMRADQSSFIVDANSFAGRFKVENRYDFLSLDQCIFQWELARFFRPSDKKASHEVLASGKTKGPTIEAHSQGELQLNLPNNWQQADVLYVSAIAPDGSCLYTWGYYWKTDQEWQELSTGTHSLSYERNDQEIQVSLGETKLRFDPSTGYLRSFGSLSLSNGPRFVAARRSDRSMDVFYNHDDKQAKSKDRIYQDISGQSELTNLVITQSETEITLTADYRGNLKQVVWHIQQDGNVWVDYEYGYEGVVELAGICFDFPEDKMQSVRYLGKGPYRVWQNRMHGTVIDVWENDYNDPIPGESFIYPEFKGYFNDWKWAHFTTSEGCFLLQNQTPNSFLGIYTPRDGRDALLYTLPQSGIAILDVIPGVRNKVNSTDLVGPSSQAKWLSGTQRGRFHLSVE